MSHKLAEGTAAGAVGVDTRCRREARRSSHANARVEEEEEEEEEIC